MKQLNIFINEKLRLSKNKKIINDEIIDLDLVPEKYQDYIKSILPFEIETQGRQIVINKCVVIERLKIYKFYNNQTFMFSSKFDNFSAILNNNGGQVWGRIFDAHIKNTLSTGYINIKIL